METIYGNLKGLKSSQIKQLQRLYEDRQPGDRSIAPEFAQRLAAISTEIHLPPQQLPRQGADRLSGIRCISTQFKSEPPDAIALTAMARQRLDALAVLILTGTGSERRGGGFAGYIQETYLAHLAAEGETPWIVSGSLRLDELTQQDFDELVREWETDLQQSDREMLEWVDQQPDLDKVLLVGLMTDEMSPQQFEEGLAELTRLVESAGGIVLDTIRQKRSHPHPQTVVGQGKVEEIAVRAQQLGANLIAFDRDISASQIRNLENQIGLAVVDRTEVILDIFAQRAQSQAGKIQVELAQLEYALPRLRGRGQEMSRLGGGIGTRGPGETKLETERRTIQRRLAQLQQEVNQLQAHRARLRQQRQQQEIKAIALVGYTNAGKSTLLNSLTHAEVYTADRLFATLDPTTRKLVISDPETQERTAIVLIDTVGFIHELPPPLMDAFRATLEEVTEADALLHVVDLSHPAWENHIRSVEEVLAEMPAPLGPILLVFNKCDRVDRETLALAQQNYPGAAFISATQRLGLDALRQRIVQLIDQAVSPPLLLQRS